MGDERVERVECHIRRSLPETEVIVDLDERTEFFRVWNKKTSLGWRYTSVFIGVMLILFPVQVTFEWLFRNWGLRDPYVSPLAAGIWGGIGAAVTQLINAGAMRRMARKMLWERGYPVCLKCGYDLAQLTQPRCPECGTEFDEAAIMEALERREDVD